MGNAEFIRHIYKAAKAVKSYTVYDLQTVQNGSLQLTHTLRIEQYRGFSNAHGITHYLRLRDARNWKGCEKVTGLRPISKMEVFHGNRKQGTKSLLLFQFSEDRQNLILDVFPSFYPHHKGILQKIIKNHSYHL